MDYKVGDTVLYGTDGVCRIAEITNQKIGGTTLTYYILKPIYNEKSTIFVPVDNKTLLDKMKRILSKEEILAALSKAGTSEFHWIEDNTERKDTFKDILLKGALADMLVLMKNLCIHQKNQEEKGKKLHVFDERILKETEKALFDELSLVLNINRDDIRSFLEKQLNLTAE